ncbi:Protein tyrosine kinase [Rhizoctonia solani]|uniref:Protein tyrosine kinase n=1 Tax=Rhizoctonia solani TaxID=456999 RepID=A0A8H7HAD5_9AGAM|nr:Protein tyrosine kinase [Rhizoctonia solani]
MEAPVPPPPLGWNFDTTTTPATPLKLDIANLSPVQIPTHPRTLHRLPTPDPSRTFNSSLGSDVSSALVLSPEQSEPTGTLSAADTGSETVQNSPKTAKLSVLQLNIHDFSHSIGRLAPPSTRISPLPSPTGTASEYGRRLASDHSPTRGTGSPMSPTESNGSPRSTTSRTSAFFASGFGSSAGPTPAPPTPLVKSKSISRLHQPSRSSTMSSSSTSGNSNNDDGSSTFAFNSGMGGASVNRSASDSKFRQPPRKATANDSFFSQSAATLMPEPPPSLSRRPSARSQHGPTSRRPGTPDRDAGPSLSLSPDRAARLPPRERFFPSRSNVDRRDQWEEATGGGGGDTWAGYGSPPGLSGFASAASLGGLASWENRRWGGSQASTGWSGGSSRGASPARPETRAFVDLDEGVGVGGGGTMEPRRPSLEEVGQQLQQQLGAKDKPAPTVTTSLSADWRALANENTPRPVTASLPAPINLTHQKKPVRSAHARAGGGEIAQHHHHHHPPLHREHSNLHPSNPDVPRPPSPRVGTLLCDSDVKLKLISRLGVGAFSCVWLAEDEEGSLAVGDRRAHSTSEAKRRRDRRMHGLRPSALGARMNGLGEKIDPEGKNSGSKGADATDAARGRDILRQQSPLLIESSPTARFDTLEETSATGRLVAVKMMDRALCDVNDRTRISFVREVEVLRHISHPSIVAYLHSFTTPTHHCLVVEHIGGGELFDLINKEENQNKMSETLLRRLWGELCRAVGWMHSVALVHRDIKLENILVTSNPFTQPVPPLTTPLLKLTDFGLSRFIDPDNPKLTTRCGSEEYAAPEIIMGSPYDGRETDAWACGVVLFALSTGVLPFADPSGVSPAPSTHSAHSPTQQRRSYLLRIAQCQYDPRELGEGVRRIVGRLLVRSPEKRAKIAELWSDPWMRGAGAPPPPPGWSDNEQDAQELNGEEHEAAYLVDKESIASVARQEIPVV